LAKPDEEKQQPGIWNKIRHCRFLSLAGIIGPVVFVSIMFSLDIIQWETIPILQTISDLVHGTFGWLQTMSFVIIGILLLFFVTRLYSITRKKWSSLTGFSSLGVTGISFFLIAAFPSQIGNIGQTIQGLIHNSIAGVLSASFIIGGIAFALHFRKDPHWKPYWIYTAMTVLLCLISAVSWAIAPESQVKALSERLLLVSGFIWMLVISIKLIRPNEKPQPAPVPVEERDFTD
jgi:hypothetical protein